MMSHDLYCMFSEVHNMNLAYMVGKGSPAYKMMLNSLVKLVSWFVPINRVSPVSSVLTLSIWLGIGSPAY